MKVCQCGTLTQMMTRLTWEIEHRLSLLVRSVNPCSLCLPWFYYVLLHFICILLPLLCWTVYMSFLLWNSSYPKDRFLMYLLWIIMFFCVCIWSAESPARQVLLALADSPALPHPLSSQSWAMKKHCSLRRKSGVGGREEDWCKKNEKMWKTKIPTMWKTKKTAAPAPPAPPKKKCLEHLTCTGPKCLHIL